MALTEFGKLVHKYEWLENQLIISNTHLHLYTRLAEAQRGEFHDELFRSLDFWGYTLINYFFALFIQAVVHEKLFVSFLNHPALNYMGKMSYGMYIYHYPIIWLITLLRPKYKAFLPYTDLETAFVFLIGLVLTVLVSSLSYHWFETPINNLKDRFFPIRPNPQTDSPS